ncbi:hypothetical protein D3227_28345 [Mesorhizobium waimense]|uniref:Uncharacterized protein n=1 Tax=Mesorhizobium waimense TaxID=1300307 RepID=A0A3A5K7I0_9HYPH|nr:hypothetical protein D3227_28345 [Mesorhizobium waimense]
MQKLINRADQNRAPMPDASEKPAFAIEIVVGAEYVRWAIRSANGKARLAIDLFNLDLASTLPRPYSAQADPPPAKSISRAGVAAPSE